MAYRRHGRAVLAAIVAVAIGVVGAAAASAHNVLVSIDPADGAHVTTAPTQVVLTFNEDVAPVGSIVKVAGPSGSATTGEAVVAGVKVTQPLTAGVPNGDYVVTYRVVSADGHPISGQSRFVVADPSTATEAPATTQTSAPTSLPGPQQSTTSTRGSDGTVSADAPTSDAAPWVWWLIGVLIAAAAVGGLIVRRRNRSGSGTSG